MSGCGAGLRASLAVALGLALGLSVGSGLAPGVARAAEAGIGLRAPACELTPLHAPDPASAVEPVTFVRAFEGRITLVDFWASWCPTCEHAFGYLNALARDYHAAGLDVVAVNLDANPRDALDFLADRFAGRPIAFELARDATGRCPRGFGLVGMPQAFLVDASGRVQAVTRGFRAGDARALRDRIETLLEGGPAALPAVAAGPATTERATNGSAADGPSRPTDPHADPHADRRGDPNGGSAAAASR
ncbi:MAG: TlpA family protein disulfide reductase [Deltaproteobacteria bacterium]|nr:TlpA family protein disulfide reductase [Deltaproteobacteria bacterium]